MYSSSCLEIAFFFEKVDEDFGHLLWRLEHAVLLRHLHDELSRHRLLVRVINAREALDFARACSLVESLRVTRLTHGQRDFHVHLDKVTGLEPGAHGVPVGLVRRDEGDNGDDASLREELRHFANTSDVLGSVLRGETQIGVESVANVITIEHVARLALAVQRVFERERERALAAAAEAREPEDNALLAQRGLALLPVDASFVPFDVC